MANKSTNSIMTRTRSRFGKLLTFKEFNELSAMKTVPEIADYLINSDQYKGYLNEIKDYNVHRYIFEKALRNAYFAKNAELCDFDSTVGKPVFYYIVKRLEIDILMDFLRALQSGGAAEFRVEAPAEFKSHCEINIKDLNTIADMQGFKAFLKASPYQKAISILPDDNLGQIDFPELETAFDRIMYQRIFSKVREEVNSKERKEFVSLLDTRTEILDFLTIYRSKLYFITSPDVIRSRLIGYRSYLTEANINDMLNAQTKDDVVKIFKSTSYGRLVSDIDTDSGIDIICRSLLYKIARKKIFFSQYPSVVLLAYLLCFESEIENLVTIIEGVRYGLPENDIKKSIILYDKGKG